ncbi:MAG TPA: aminoglycoside phosphotransferase family protein, partial [Micromonosporaceae bacterium]|nr:aminoglycoside phosphotransferase family protein [Micromonosporaceae bacterium]
MTTYDRASALGSAPTGAHDRAPSLGRPYVTAQEIPLHGGNVSTVVRAG